MSLQVPAAGPESNRLERLRYRLHLRRRSIQAGYFLAALLIGLTLGLPLLYMFATSFKPALEVFHTPPTFFPQNWTLDGYRELINLSNVPLGFRNSAIVSTLSSTLGVLLSIGLCYVLTRFRLPGMGFFSFMTLFVYILPSILLAIPMYQIWSRLGLAGGLLPLALTYVSITLPFAIWMMRSYFAGVPLELEEAALVDGATRSQAFLKIVLPLVRPGIIATFIFTFILSWNDVLYATIFASSIQNQVVSTALAAMLQESSGWLSWGMVNAAGVAATVPVLLFFILIQRQLVTGFTAGAVKG